MRTSGAHEEGGERDFSVMTTHFEGEDGKVKRLHGHEVGPPPSFEKIEGSEFAIDCRPRAAGDGLPAPAARGRRRAARRGARRPRQRRRAEPTTRARVPGVFAAGDARRGQSLIVWAINEGRQCARGGRSLAPRNRARGRGSGPRRSPRGGEPLNALLVSPRTARRGRRNRPDRPAAGERDGPAAPRGGAAGSPTSSPPIRRRPSS